jgi:hypothetical protein
MSFLTDSSKSNQSQQSLSYNRAYDPIATEVGGILPAAREAVGAYNGFLGGDTSGFNAFKNQTGYNQAAVQAGQGVAANGAASGLLNSGATGKRFTAAQSGLDNQYANQYLDRLAQKFGFGKDTASLMGATGNWSNSFGSGSSGSQGGKSDILGSAFKAIGLSDRSAKENIKKIGEMDDGLGVYEFNYIGKSETKTGVMADEVEVLRPWALGPVVQGYKTVDYGAL